MEHSPKTELSSRAFTQPHPQRLTPEHPDYRRILRVHELALAAGQPGYLDPTSGLYVMTAEYLAQRGFCCDNGCRHCPYID